jgi:hypothetical protein
VQIGGDQFSPFSAELLTPEGDVVGYVRKQGLFARLLPYEYTNRYGTFHCDSTSREQSVGIFSPSACGPYGFDSTYMADNGLTSGTIRLESRRHTVTLYAGSAALLQVNVGRP